MQPDLRSTDNELSTKVELGHSWATLGTQLGHFGEWPNKEPNKEDIQMTERLPRIRLDSRHDEDLIGWLAELNHLPFGTKGQIIKQTLRRGLGVSSQQTKKPTTEAFDSQELLSDIRRVVEATLESVISRLSITPLTTDPRLSVPDEIDALLDDFGANLMMLDEEEDDA